MRRYVELGDAPPYLDLAINDAVYGGHGAHTIDRHGPAITLRRVSGTKTIEGRIYGDAPWSSAVTRSYQWLDLPTADRVVNAYVRRHWQLIRADLAGQGFHQGDADAGRRIGRGFFSSGRSGTGRRAQYDETSTFMVRLRLAPEPETPEPYVVTAFPWH
jgi:hypothetical protein